jgi:hypothetical protein
MTGRVAELAAVSVLALLLTVAVAAPVLWAPSERIFGMDIVGRHHDPFSVMEQFGGSVAPGIYFQPLTDIPGILFARLVRPVAAYNWLVLLTFPLSAAAAYLLARHLALSPPGAAIAALAFAFSPFHLAHAAYHPHVAQTQWLPLYLLALWRCLDAATPAAVVFLALSTAAVVLSNFYGGLIAAVITPVAIVTYWGFKSRRQEGSLGRLAVTIGGLVGIACVGAAFAWPAAHRVFANSAGFATARQDLFRYSARWWSYFLPPIEHPALGGTVARIWSAAGVHEGLLEQQVSLGWGLVGLSLVALAACLRNRRNSKSLAVVPVLAITAFVALVCSLSPEHTVGAFTFKRPSAFIYRELPMFRSYARFGVVVQLMVAALAAIGAERLWNSQRRRERIACCALLALAVAEYAVWPPAMWRDVLPTEGHRWVANQPNRIHALDCELLTPESRSIQWLSGYRISLLDTWLDDCTEPNLADKLSLAGFTHLLVRRETATGQRFDTLSPSGDLKVVARFDDSAVFAVERTPLVATLDNSTFYAREHDETWTWQWMGREASWKILSQSHAPIAASVDVDMMSFQSARRMQVRLDDREVQTLVVDERRGITRLGPFALKPGAHDLVFYAIDAPTIAADLINNGDRRPLSFAFGTWRWIVEEPQP